MHAQLVQIGNSKGLRLPKTILRQCGIVSDVELEVSEGAIIVRPAAPVRQGWAEAARELAASGGGEPMLEGFGNEFDEKNWQW